MHKVLVLNHLKMYLLIFEVHIFFLLSTFEVKPSAWR